MVNSAETKIPLFFLKLMHAGVISSEDVLISEDSFCAVTKSVASMLISRGIEEYPDDSDSLRKSQLFFDDWFLYCVPGIEGSVYSLFKMREQEFDREMGLVADGDVPGVTVSFVAFDPSVLDRCLSDPNFSNKKALGMEINRVVAYRAQQHHPDLKAYFEKPEAIGPYRICDLYIRRMASFASNGVLNVPKAYLEIYEKRNMSRKYSRIPDFLEENNRNAGYVVCDHRKIYINDIQQLTPYEKQAILATHTGNCNVHSFAAEVRYHAMFLTDIAKVRIPLIGSPYESAIRADMSIGDKEFQGPTPYYQLTGKLVSAQMRLHEDEK